MPDRAAESAKKNKPDLFAAEHQPVSSGNGSLSAPSPAQTMPGTPRKLQRPVTIVESKPRAEPPTNKPTTKPTKPATPPAAAPAPVVRPVIPGGSSGSGLVRTSATPRGVPLDRPFRWPPAYDVQPKDGRSGVITFEESGNPGIITFDDEPDPKSAQMANLKRQVQSVCGKQARDVFVETQRDGNVLVKVKVTNTSNEDRLTRKILTIPEMASPKVRLTMDSSP
jgi:hypothetical protein